jgi:hypothetical protein
MDHNIYEYITGALWKDENFDIASYRATGASPPDEITIPGTSIITVSFDGGGTTEDIAVCKELNHDYQEGTPISFHVHWYPTTTGAGNVKWQLEYYIASQASATVVSGLTSVTQAAGGAAWRLQTANFPDINLGAIGTIGCQIHFRFFRNPSDAADTYAADAAVGTMGYHYLTNSRGSAQRAAK